MVMVVDIKVLLYFFLVFVKSLRLCEFEIDDNLDGEDDKEETKKVADIRMCHFSVEIVHR